MESNNVVQIIDALAEKFGMVVDWTSQNVVPYIQDLMGRIIQYEIWTSWFWIGFMATLVVGFAIPFFIYNKKASQTTCYAYDMDEPCTVAFVIFATLFAIATFVSLFVIPDQVLDIIECHTIPEKVFIEYIGNYIN